MDDVKGSVVYTDEEKDLNNLLKGAAKWGGYYRENPQRFCKDYLNVKLRRYQKFLIFNIVHNRHTIIWAARGAGKTWLTALCCVVICILFPGTKICVCSKTRVQANEILQKITDELMQKHDWGSANLRAEISDYSINPGKAEILFHNSSWIRVVTARDSGRGYRANMIVLDEFYLMKKEVIDAVIKRFLANPRQPEFLLRPEYAGRRDLLEDNREVSMSSCGFKDHWTYEKTKSYFANMLGGREGYFVCGLPYQVLIYEGLKKREEIEDEMTEPDFDPMHFSMEMECLPYGSAADAFFEFDDIDKCRRLKNAVYPGKYSAGAAKSIPPLMPNERRILSLDVALMASKTHKNDASSIFINSALANNNKEYIANFIYTKNYEGLNTDELALITRRLFHTYQCTDLVLDTNGVGLGVYDALIKDIVDPDTNELYPALSCCNDDSMAARCKVSGAPRVIWSIKANANFNSEICVGLRNGFKKGKINLLISEYECDDVLSEKIKDYDKLSVEVQELYKLPYVETTLLVYELVSLETEIKGTNVRVHEKTGMRKDRYSSVAYNFWVQEQLERETLNIERMEFDYQKFMSKMQKINKKPITY